MTRSPLGGAFVLGALLTMTASPLMAQTRTVEVHGATLPYMVQGSGPPLVLVHGWAVDHHFWDGVADTLARHYTVIRYDRRGFGHATGHADPTADPADLAALLRTLGHARAHVMGHSAGVGAALGLALRHPAMVAGLVLYGPGPISGVAIPAGDDAPPFAQWVMAGQTYGVDSLRAAIGRWAAERFGGTLSPEEMERAGRMLGAYSGADLLAPAPPSNLVAPPRLDELGTIRAPTLIILGSEEMAFIRAASDAYASHIPGAERVEIPGGGHVVSWQEPERFTDAVLAFLRRVDATR